MIENVIDDENQMECDELAANLYSARNRTTESTNNDNVVRLECFESAFNNGAEGLRGSHADFVGGSFACKWGVVIRRGLVRGMRWDGRKGET